MASNQKTTVPIISDDMILDFFQTKGVGAECPCCRSSLWHRLEEPFAGTNYAIRPYVDSLSNFGFEVVVLYCMNCGFTRQHAAHLIRKWAEEHYGK